MPMSAHPAGSERGPTAPPTFFVTDDHALVGTAREHQSAIPLFAAPRSARARTGS